MRDDKITRRDAWLNESRDRIDQSLIPRVWGRLLISEAGDRCLCARPQPTVSNFCADNCTKIDSPFFSSFSWHTTVHSFRLQKVPETFVHFSFHFHHAKNKKANLILINMLYVVAAYFNLLLPIPCLLYEKQTDKLYPS